MKKICVIGAGFAGLAAAKKFFGSGNEIFLFDKKRSSDFLPMLPDVIGRGVDPKLLAASISELSRKLKCHFINAEVKSVDIPARRIDAEGRHFDYDYLLICSGSESAYYGREDLRAASMKLDSAADADVVRKALNEKRFANYVVCGGGYTGIEVATNLRRLLDLRKEKGDVTIVERAPSILGPLPGWMKEYTIRNLRDMRIEVATETSVEAVDGESVNLSSGSVLDNSLFIWTAGVKTPSFVDSIPAEKSTQGRLKVDEFLRLFENVFVAGDCACFSAGGSCLRMGVQFSISQGNLAAANVLRAIRGRRLRAWKPYDPGYVIPMANNISCGNIMGVNMRGIVPTFLHYFMCLYRTAGLGNRVRIGWKLLKGGRP